MYLNTCLKWLLKREKIKFTETNETMKRIVPLFLIFLSLISTCFCANAKDLVITKNGTAKYIISDHEIVTISLMDHRKLEGVLTILSDSTLKIDQDSFSIADIYAIKVSKGNDVGKAVGVVGLIGGTGLMIFGISLMSEDGVVGLITGFPGFVMTAVGAVIDGIALTALLSSGGKWIHFSENYSSYDIKVI